MELRGSGWAWVALCAWGLGCTQGIGVEALQAELSPPPEAPPLLDEAPPPLDEAPPPPADLLPPQIAVSHTGAAQGRTTAWFVATDEPAQVSLWVGGQPHPIYPIGPQRWRALLGFDPQQPVGRATVEVRATDPAGNEARETHLLDIQETEFVHGGFIQLQPAQVQARQDLPALDALRTEREAAFDHPIDTQHWEGPMRLPVEGRKTSPFGKYRAYSDGHRTHHTGVDLAAPRGTPVGSAAAGEVLVAGWQTVYGNVVIVHHGRGVATSYNHLDEVLVQVGQRVDQGEAVGRLGSTGQSTGPHLHWGLTVHGVKVDAEQWLETGFALEPEEEEALAAALQERSLKVEGAEQVDGAEQGAR